MRYIIRPPADFPVEGIVVRVALDPQTAFGCEVGNQLVKGWIATHGLHNENWQGNGG